MAAAGTGSRSPRHSAQPLPALSPPQRRPGSAPPACLPACRRCWALLDSSRTPPCHAAAWWCHSGNRSSCGQAGGGAGERMLVSGWMLLVLEHGIVQSFAAVALTPRLPPSSKQREAAAGAGSDVHQTAGSGGSSGGSPSRTWATRGGSRGWDPPPHCHAAPASGPAPESMPAQHIDTCSVYQDQAGSTTRRRRRQCCAAKQRSHHRMQPAIAWLQNDVKGSSPPPKP